MGFSKRDSLISLQEKKGIIEYVTIYNDESYESMKFLIDIKNIFSRQLPKMPKEYIVRMVFDRNHKCLLILKNKTMVVGGICYRLFAENHFAEIVFLAITPKEQIKGFGTRLMNHFKEKMRIEKIRFLMTYADNYAVGRVFW